MVFTHMKDVLIPSGEVDFARLQLVGEGGHRTVYSSPDYPGVIFKLQKSLAERQRDVKGLRWYLFQYFAGFENYNTRLESITYTDLCMARPEILAKLPIARFYGFACSSAGLLQMTEKISLDGTTVGPTLRQVCMDGAVTTQDAESLTMFARSLLASRIPTHDLRDGNIVKGLDRHGQERFALIDGIGDIRLIQMKKYVARYQRAHLVRFFSSLEEHGLRFDAENFHLTRI